MYEGYKYVFGIVERALVFEIIQHISQEEKEEKLNVYMIDLDNCYARPLWKCPDNLPVVWP